MGAINNFYAFLSALFFALIIVPPLRQWALKKGFMDAPDFRKIHTTPIPRLGGIAIFLGFLFANLIHTEITPEIRGILVGTLIIFVTGLIDDFYGMSAKSKFIGEILGCIATMAIGHLYLYQFGDLFGFGDITLPLWLAVPFTVFAVVGVTNALNFMDGLDGLAGGISVIALSAFYLLGYHSEATTPMILSAILLGSTLGFLKYNSYPARIFMGDSGSLVVGFLLGFLAILLTQGRSAKISPVVPLIILGLPIIDTLWVMTRRIIKRGSPFSPDKTHVHHKFLNFGFNHRITVIVIYGISLFWAVTVLVFHQQPEAILFGTYIVISIIFYRGLSYLNRQPHRVAQFIKNGAMGFRDSVYYKQLVEICHYLFQYFKVVILLYLGVVLLFGNGAEETITRLSLLIMLGSFGLLLATRKIANNFLLVSLFAALIIIQSHTDHYNDLLLLPGLEMGQFVNVLLAIGAVLVFLKIIFKRPGETFLTTPLDFLILTLSVSLTIVTPEIDLSYDFKSTVLKSIVLFLGIKILFAQEKAPTRLIFFAIQTVLLIFVVRGKLF
jgi:UDP-GlcNAc:undecaprenyl-phosphate/decaprenyl-phosphate GlcNAc-1-phosphate transferase